MAHGPLSQLPPAPRVAVVRALGGLGDWLCATPALRALRAGLPWAHVTVVGLSRANFTEHYPHLVDGFLAFPGFPGIPEGPSGYRALPGFLRAVRGRFDLALQLHGSGLLTNPFTLLLEAPLTAGTYLPGMFCPDSRTFVPHDETLSEPGRALAVVGRLGLSARGDHLEFPITERDRETLPSLGVPLPDRYAVLHPGAAASERRWPPDCFARVAEVLTEEGLKVVLTGSAGEAEVAAAVRRAARVDILDLCGQTDLGTLAALLAGARLLVTNDTGVSHLAAATGTPSVVVFLISDPQRWAPPNRARHRPVVRPVVGDVLAEVRSILEGSPV